jgi:hypothetical protein
MVRASNKRLQRVEENVLESMDRRRKPQEKLEVVLKDENVEIHKEN